MKTNFEHIDGRWVTPTGKVVAVEFINYGDDYDIILGDQYKDVCTGETFAKEKNYEMSEAIGETVWTLVKHFDEMPEYKLGRRGNPKKMRRKHRIDEMSGVYWGNEFKSLGKNRFLRRRRMPSKEQLDEFNNNLPF